MWLFKSSIGRKFVMAVTGVALVLFVTFHVLMNSVALIWPVAYNQVCEFLGANWYALIASMGLAVLFIIHIIYAIWLTLQNRAARGADRYAVNTRPPQVEWSSKNMLVLGIVVVAFLVVHLIQFWAKMQLQELRHAELTVLPQLEGVPVGPAQGTLFIQLAFKEIWTPIVYIIGFVALWFHMTHGFWSMFHTIGWDNNKWISRLKCIGNAWTTIVILLFIAQAIVFTVQAHRDYYTTNEALQEQYAEFWNAQAEKAFTDFQDGFYAEAAPLIKILNEPGDLMAQQKANNDLQALQEAYVSQHAAKYVEVMGLIEKGFEKECPKIQPTNEYMRAVQMAKSMAASLPAQPASNK